MGKKVFRYTQSLKTYEVELTWELFIKGLNEHIEYFFTYGNSSIDIAYHYENNRKVFELNVNGREDSMYLQFETVDELVSCEAFNGKSLQDIWDELEN